MTVETLVLTSVGAALGMAAGWGGIRLLATLGAERLPLGSQIAFDARLAFVAMPGAILLGIVLAVPIAWFQLHAGLAGAIQSETRGGTSNKVSRNIRHGFIVAQIALALTLLSGAGLLRLSLKRIMAVSPGFRADHVLTARLSLPGSQYRGWPARPALNARLLTELSGLPGVLATGMITNIPVSGDTGKDSATVKGRAPRPGETVRAHYSYGVDGDYFRAMGFSLVMGRFLNAADSRRSDRVCVVDDDFARYYWPNGGALGQRLFEGSLEATDAEAFTIVGVVGAVKQAGLTDDAAQGAVYYPAPLRGDDRSYIVVRTRLKPESLGPGLRTIVRQAGLDVTLYDLRSMDARIADSLVTRRAPALLAAIFSTIALLLTAVGTYGVLSYAVEQRRREIGIRIALGARTQQIRRQFLLLASHLLLAGTMLGLVGAWLTGRAMRNLLFQVPPFHPATLAEAAVVIAAVSLAACVLPAHSAAQVSPMEALRDAK